MPFIPIFLISICFVGIVCWMTVALRDITRHRRDLERADKQLAMYQALHSNARDIPEKVRTQEQVDISHMIYQNVAHAYNLCLKKPQNKLLARIMGYHVVTVSQNQD